MTSEEPNAMGDKSPLKTTTSTTTTATNSNTTDFVSLQAAIEDIENDDTFGAGDEDIGSGNGTNTSNLSSIQYRLQDEGEAGECELHPASDLSGLHETGDGSDDVQKANQACVQDLAQMSADELMDKLDHLKTIAYSLGQSEAHEMTRGRLLNVFGLNRGNRR